MAETLGDRARARDRGAHRRRGRDRAGGAAAPPAAARSSGSPSPASRSTSCSRAIVEVFGSWRDITRFSLGSLAGDGRRCRSRRSPACGRCSTSRCGRTRWRPVITSQLAGNALAKVAPGGGAMGAALQYQMLVRAGAAAGRDRDGADRGQPARVRRRAGAAGAGDPGAAARRRRPHAARDRARSGWRCSPSPSARRRGVALHRPPAGVGRAARSSASATGCAAAPSRCTRLPERLLRERDRILDTLGPRWKRALAATVGRWTFDYLTLLAALAAIGSHPRPGLVLLAFCGAQVLAQIPITPGGLGFVEAGLTAMLALAGVSRGRRGARDVRLPAVLLLAAAAARAARARASARASAAAAESSRRSRARSTASRRRATSSLR